MSKLGKFIVAHNYCLDDKFVRSETSYRCVYSSPSGTYINCQGEKHYVTATNHQDYDYYVVHHVYTLPTVDIKKVFFD